MQWYYAVGNEQKGPISPEEFEELVKSGTIRPESLVWNEGMTNWLPYAQVVGLQTAGAASVPPMPGALPGTVAAGISEDELRAADYEVDIGGCLSRGWDLFKAAPGPMIGAYVLITVASMAIGLVPYLGALVSLVLTGPLMGGLWLFMIRSVRRASPTVGEAFSGFGPRFGQLALTSIVTSVLTGLCMIPLIGAVILGVVTGALGSEGNDQGAIVTGVILIPVAILALLGLLAAVYLGVSWYFAIPLVADKNYDFWSAMRLSRARVGRHWWGTLLLILVFALLGLLGTLACVVGVLIAAPVGFAMTAAHYERVFGSVAARLE